MPSAVTGLGASTSAVEPKLGPPEWPGSSTTTGRLAEQAGAGSAPWIDARTVRTGSDRGAAPEAPPAATQHTPAPGARPLHRPTTRFTSDIKLARTGSRSSGAR